MKKLFTTLFTLILFTNTYSQELFSGNWDPVKNSKTIYSRNFNILNKDVFIISYTKKQNYYVANKSNTTLVLNKEKFNQLNYLHEYVIKSGRKNIKTVIYNPKNNYRVYVDYHLKSRKKIIATFTDFETKKITATVVYKRTK